MEIKCTSLMINLMEKIIGAKTISDLWLLDHGNSGNKGYFNTRIKKNSKAPFNDHAITLMLDCFRYHLGLNTVKNNNIPDDKSSSIANKLLSYINEIKIIIPKLNLENIPGNPENVELRKILLSLLEIILSECLNKASVNIDRINTKISIELPEILEKTMSSVESTSETNSVSKKIEGLLSAGIFNIVPSAKNKSKLSIPKCIPSFVGREDYLTKIETKINSDGYAIIEGIGGIGKSELAKKYVALHTNNYDEIIWVYFANSIKNTICSIPFAEDALIEKESLEEKYSRKLTKLLSYESGLLLIIDNFDAIDEDVMDIIGYDFDIILTTRTHFWEESIDLGSLNHKDAFTLFHKHCKKYNTKSENDVIAEILNAIEYHTLLIELIGKHIQCGSLTPQKMLEKIKENINIDDDTLIPIRKDNTIKSAKINQHICSLFELDKEIIADNTLLLVLANSSLISNFGLYENDFRFLLGLDNNNPINKLADLGWLQISNDGIIKCHMIIKDTVYQKYNSKIYLFEKTLNNSINLVLNQENIEYDVNHIMSLCGYVVNLSNKFHLKTKEWCYTLILFSYFLGEFHHYNDAITVIKKAEELLEDVEFDNPIQAPNFYSMSASIYAMVNDLKSATKLQKKAEELFEAIPNKDKIANIETIQSMIYDTSATLAYKTGEVTKAKEIYSNYVVSPTTSDNTLPGVYIVNQEYEKAEKVARKNLETTIKESGEQSKFTAEKYNILGNCLAYLNREQDSIDCHKAAIAILDKLKINSSVENADAYFSYARSLEILHNTKDAIKYVTSALQIYEKIEDIPCDTLMEAYSLSGECLAFNNKFEAAKDHLAKAVQICLSMNENIPMPILANYLYQLAKIYEKTGPIFEAVTIYDRCCHVIDKITDHSMIYFSILEPYILCADFYTQLNMRKEAETYLNKLEQLFTSQKIENNKAKYILFISTAINFYMKNGDNNIAYEKVKLALSFFDKHQNELYRLYKSSESKIITKFTLLYWNFLIAFRLEEYGNSLIALQNAIKNYEKHPYPPDKPDYDMANMEWEALLLVFTDTPPTDCPHLLAYESTLTLDSLSQNDYIAISGLARYYQLRGDIAKYIYYKNLLAQLDYLMNI